MNTESTDELQGCVRQYTEAFAARLHDHLHRFAKLGETDSDVVFEDGVYQLLKMADVDWDGLSCNSGQGKKPDWFRLHNFQSLKSHL